VKSGSEAKLYMLAFDHRGNFKEMLGVTGDATPEQMQRLQTAKQLIWSGVRRALDDGVPKEVVGILVDEEMGSMVAREAKALGVKLAMPVEASGRSVFEFEFGDRFKDHIEDFDPDFNKVLVRWNPADTDEDKAAQSERLKQLSDWLHKHGRKLLFELLVPASARQLDLVGGDTEAYDTEVRPYLTLVAIDEIIDAGIEPDIWKVEGFDRPYSCRLFAELIRRNGRDDIVAVVLGRGADDAKVDHWLRTGAPVVGYSGFAIGRSIWSSEVAGWNNGDATEEEVATAISANYRRFISVYEGTTGS